MSSKDKSFTITGRADGAGFQRAAAVGRHLESEFPGACSFEVHALDASEWEFFAANHNLVRETEREYKKEEEKRRGVIVLA